MPDGIREPEDRGDCVVIHHDDPHYGPWIVRGAQPKGLRDAWRVLRGTYEPRVVLSRAMTAKGFDRVLKRVFSRENMKGLF